MSLDWSIERVPNYKERCWVDIPPEEQNRMTGEVRLDDDTNALIWGSIMVDMGSITVRNIDEWCFRIQFLRRVGIDWIQYFDDNDNIVGFYPSRCAVEDHIGLSTNVTTMTRAKWLNKIKRRLERETEQAIEAEIRKREKENNA